MIRRIVTSAFLVIMAMVLFRTGLAHGQYIDAGWDGSTYTSPAYGYSVSWDEQEWEVGDSVGTAGFELRTRFASTGSLHIRAFRPKSGTPEECIDLWANSRFRTEGVSGFQQFESDGKPIGAQDASSAYGLFEYEYDGEDRCTDE